MMLVRENQVQRLLKLSLAVTLEKIREAVGSENVEEVLTSFTTRTFGGILRDNNEMKPRMSGHDGGCNQQEKRGLILLQS